MITLVDFEDSFTYNIFSQLKILQAKEIEVIHYSELPARQFKKSQVVILGPGPGHPKEYDQVHPTIKQLMKRKDILLVGICLGHQLIWSLQGAKIARFNTPIHGQSVHYQNFSIKHLDEHIFVQRYNSLYVKLSDRLGGLLNSHSIIQDDELVAYYDNHLLTYQFHPESVGTSFPEQFFKPILDYLI